MKPMRPDHHGSEPADLSELTATDALLDRLGARAASADDLDDPTVAGFVDLLAEIDESRVPDAGAARLLEVLKGRPLYIAGPDVAAERRAGLTGDADLTGDGTAGQGAAAGHPRLIDLTGLDPAGRAGAGPAGLTGPDPAAGPESIPAARRPQPAFVPLRPATPLAAARRRSALRHVSLPAASVLLLVALGGGVSAAVTGDPMTPVNGISRVVAQLPGVYRERGRLDRVRGEIKAADRAVAKRDAPAAHQHLNAARRGLDGVPEAEKPDLNRMIASVQTRLGTHPPADVTEATPTLPVTVPTTAPVVEESDPPAVPTTEAPQPSLEPSPDPEPSVPASPEPEETSPAPVTEESLEASPSAP